jgi:arylsulfatase
VLFFGPDGSLMSVKWHHIKMWLRYCEGIDQPILKPQFPMFFDLASDPGERYNLFKTKLDMGWMFGITLQAVGEYEKSVAQYPNIKPARSSPGTRPRPAADEQQSAQLGVLLA